MVGFRRMLPLQHSCWFILSFTDTVNPGKPLPELDDGVQAHLVHEESDNEVSKHRWLLGPARIPCEKYW